MTAHAEAEVVGPGNSGRVEGPGAYLFEGKRPMATDPDVIEVEPIAQDATLPEREIQLPELIPAR